MPSAFLDYQIIDHLHRIASGAYKGANQATLQEFESRARAGDFELWMAEITKVEMIIGRENPRVRNRFAELVKKDDEKLALAESLKVRWLGYPCSKLNDTYSRLGVSFRSLGPNGGVADEFERQLERVSGVSKGDARQVTSVAYGFDEHNVAYRPKIEWFVTEDASLRTALRSEVNLLALHDLGELKVVSVLEFVDAA